MTNQQEELATRLLAVEQNLQEQRSMYGPQLEQLLTRQDEQAAQMTATNASVRDQAAQLQAVSDAMALQRPMIQQISNLDAKLNATDNQLQAMSAALTDQRQQIHTRLDSQDGKLNQCNTGQSRLETSIAALSDQIADLKVHVHIWFESVPLLFACDCHNNASKLAVNYGMVLLRLGSLCQLLGMEFYSFASSSHAFPIV